MISGRAFGYPWRNLVSIQPDPVGLRLMLFYTAVPCRVNFNLRFQRSSGLIGFVGMVTGGAFAQPLYSFLLVSVGVLHRPIEILRKLVHQESQPGLRRLPQPFHLFLEHGAG